MNIDISIDHAEAEEFCLWLNMRDDISASVGRSTGNYVDGNWTSSNIEEDEILNNLWYEYCNAA